LKLPKQFRIPYLLELPEYNNVYLPLAMQNWVKTQMAPIGAQLLIVFDSRIPPPLAYT